MRLTRVLPAAAYAALALVDTALAGSPSSTARRFRLVTKPLLMPALGTAFALSLSDEDVAGGGLLQGCTVAGQACSGVGDIALLDSREPAFLVGLGSFAGAHVAYTSAFLSAGRPLTDRTHVGGVVTAAALLGTLGPVTRWAVGRRNPSLKGPVVVYAGLLTAMFAASTRLGEDIPPTARRKVAAGAGLFLASDSILAANRFLLTDPPPLAEAAVMATYTTAQGLIAAGVSEAVRARTPEPAASHHSHEVTPAQPAGTTSS